MGGKLGNPSGGYTTQDGYIEYRPVAITKATENLPAGDRRRGRIDEMEHLRGCLRGQRQSVAAPEGTVAPTEERQPGDDKKAERWDGLSTSLEGASRTVHLQRDYRRQPE